MALSRTWYACPPPRSPPPRSPPLISSVPTRNLSVSIVDFIKSILCVGFIHTRTKLFVCVCLCFLLFFQVRVMYTPLMGDEKRDIVEYTSFGFMNCAHTMLTYTRAMDSALCVPLMIDAAVWCDYFARAGTPQDRVARALAYLFKVPEGGAQGVDPGFFKQMRALEEELEATRLGAPSKVAAAAEARAGGRSVQGVADMLVGRVVCAGISCLDLQLCGSSAGGGGVETIRKFEETKYCPGGSCPQASTALAQLGVPGVVAVTKMGVDAHGDEMVKQASALSFAWNCVVCVRYGMARVRYGMIRTYLAFSGFRSDGLAQDGRLID